MRRVKEDAEILKDILSVKADQPNWGYRLVWAYMKYQMNKSHNRKRIYRIMKEEGLLLTKDTQLKAVRDNQNNRNKPRADKLNQFWGTDMTKVMIPGFGWVYVVVVLDWYSKKIAGYSVSHKSTAREWLEALHNACNNQFPHGILDKQHELHLVSDNGSQPTSLRYMQACSVMEIKQIFASYNNPKGNGDTERVIKTMKHDFVWINEFSGIVDFTERLDAWVEKYNTRRPHSTLKYRTPVQFEQEQMAVLAKF